MSKHVRKPSGSRTIAARESSKGRRVRGGRIRDAWLLLIPLVVLLLQLKAWHPYPELITPESSSGEDWLSYKTRGIDVLENGLTMPSVPTNYARPAGFLYNYFVAAIFLIFGVNSTWVSIAQTTLMAVGAVVMYVILRPYLPKPLAFVYLLLVGALLYIQRSFWNLLLSEALLVVLVPFFLLLLFRAFDRDSAPTAAAAGVFIGLGVLARPNALAIPFAIAAVLWFFARRSGKRAGALLLAFLLGFSAAQLPLIVRNIVVTRSVSMATLSPAFAETADWTAIERVKHGSETTYRPAVRARTYLERMLFCLGIWIFPEGTTIVPYQIVISLGALSFAVLALVRRRLEFWEAAVAAFVVAYIVPTVLFGGVQNYQGRMVLPVYPVALVLAVAGVANVMQLFKDRKAAGVQSELDHASARR